MRPVPAQSPAGLLLGGDGFVPDGFGGEHGLPVGLHAGLLAEAEEENAVAGERAMHAEENLAARVLGEVDHDVAQKDDVEGLAGGKGLAEVALLKAAEALDVGVDFPLVVGADEVFDQEAGGQAAVDFDALIAAGAGALDHFGGDVGAEDVDSPAGEQGEMLAQHDGERVGFLAGGTGGGPEAEGAGGLAGGDEGGEQLFAKEVEGGGIAKEAGLIDGHGLGDGALEAGAGIGAKGGDELAEGLEAAVAEQALEARFEEVVAGGIDMIAGVAHDDGAQVLEVDGGGGHGATASVRCGCGEGEAT